MPAAEAEGASEEAPAKEEPAASYPSVVIEFHGELALEPAQVSLARRLVHMPQLPARLPLQDVVLSKLLSKLLRHKAVELGAAINADGWVAFPDALA